MIEENVNCLLRWWKKKVTIVFLLLVSFRILMIPSDLLYNWGSHLNAISNSRTAIMLRRMKASTTCWCQGGNQNLTMFHWIHRGETRNIWWCERLELTVDRRLREAKWFRFTAVSSMMIIYNVEAFSYYIRRARVYNERVYLTAAVQIEWNQSSNEWIMHDSVYTPVW